MILAPDGRPAPRVGAGRGRVVTIDDGVRLSAAVRAALAVQMLRTTYTSQHIFNNGYRNSAWSPPAAVYGGLLTAVAAARAGTVTEASYTGYARASITFGAPASGGGTGQKISNTNLLNYGQCTAGGPVVFIALSVWDASSSGNLLDIIFNDGADNKAFEGIDTATYWLTCQGHSLSSNQRVRFIQADPYTPLPAPLAEDTDYYVITHTADLFGVSASAGPGSQVVITAEGSGSVMKITPVTVNNNDTPQTAIGALTLFDG